jgi:regulator of sigma E protease
MTIILFLIVLAVLIVSHELGHFAVAKFFNIRVDEFGFGFPPRLLSYKKGETTYSVNIIPLGGFVSIFGENQTEEALADPTNSRAMINRPKLVQAAVLIAGVLANVVLAWFLISVALSLGVPASAGGFSGNLTINNPALMITSVMPNSPAEDAGLKPGDKIVGLIAKTETLEAPAVNTTQDFIAIHGSESIRLQYTRGLEKALHEVTVVPEAGVVNNKPAIGIGLDLVGEAKVAWPYNLVAGAVLTFNLLKVSLTGLWQVVASAFSNGDSLLSSVIGPVGLAGLVGDAQTLGWSYLLFFTAFISLNLAIFNLIPFPALDGGRLLFLLIEKIKGSRISPTVANTVNLAGFALLLVFMLFVTYNDILRLF